MTPEARAARERKQRIFVVVGGLLLVGLLAIQLPKLLGGSSSPDAASPETTSTLAGQLTTPIGTTTPAAGSAASPTTVAATSKLSSLSFFRPKDPFVQQVVVGSAFDPGVVDSGQAAAAEAKNPKSDTPATEKFSTGAKATAAATIVTVNGARQVVQPGSRFPAGDPLFVLVAEKPGSKSIVVGIVGGAYSGGDRTTTLRAGKPLTLVNTTTGAKYKISLVSVGSGDRTTKPEASP